MLVPKTKKKIKQTYSVHINPTILLQKGKTTPVVKRGNTLKKITLKQFIKHTYGYNSKHIYNNTTIFRLENNQSFHIFVF